MTPQVHFNARDRVIEADAQPAPVSASSLTTVDATAPHALTDAERQGLAMGWVSIGLGMFLLFGGLALWAAAALHAGFAGWLIGMGVMGLGIVAVLLAVTFTVIQPRR